MNWLRNHWLGMLLVVVILGAAVLVAMRPENTQKPTSQTAAVKKSPAGDEDPMAEFQKLLNQPPKPAWRVYLESYWLFGAGIGVFLGLVLVVVKLLQRKKPDADDDPSVASEDEDEPEEEGDEKPRRSTFTTVPDEDRSRSHWRIAGWIGGIICVGCIIWIFSDTVLSIGRLEKRVTELQTTKANKSEVATKEDIRHAVLVSEQNTYSRVAGTLVAPLQSEVVTLTAGVAGLTTKVEQYKKTVSTFDRRLTATGASVVKLTDRLTKFRSEATSSISANSARLDALVAGEARRDSIVSAKMSELDSLIQWTSELKKGR